MQPPLSHPERADLHPPGRRMGAKCLRLVAAMAIALTASLGVAEQVDAADEPAGIPTWRLEFSPFTHHYHYDPAHKHVRAVGLEREAPDHSLYGLTAFSNSFGQPSAYAYYGHVYDKVWDRFESLYLKWTIGIIYGYKVPFDQKIKFNHHGFAPAIIPGIGWRLDKEWSAQVNILGTSAFMLTVSKRL